MKRIVFLLWNVKQYGCNTKVFEYVQGLREKGYAIEIYSFLGSNYSLSEGNLPCKSFFRLLFPSTPIDTLIFTGFWPVAYLALWLRARRKIYYIQAIDSELCTNIFLRLLARISYRLNFERVAISHYLKEKIRRYSESPIEVIPHGIDLTVFSRKFTTYQTSKKKLRILSVVSSYHRVKGPDLLVRIIKKLKLGRKDLSFILISFKKKPYSSIFDEFAFNLSPSMMALEYRDADLLLATSRVEGFFLPALEAMACGIPVVMVNSGGVREYAKDRYNCLLVNDVSEIIEKRLVEYVLDNPIAKERLVANGLVTAQKFSFQKALDRWIEYLNR